MTTINTRLPARLIGPVDSLFPQNVLKAVRDEPSRGKKRTIDEVYDEAVHQQPNPENQPEKRRKVYKVCESIPSDVLYEIVKHLPNHQALSIAEETGNPLYFTHQRNHISIGDFEGA